MGTTAVLSAIFTLLAGIGIFLIACQMMSTNLESASSDKLKKLFAKASKSKLLGVGIGTFGTAAIQSSGATTVMTIGFVNAGIISLSQAATIIYGANIGTTITAQIVALGMFGGSNSLSTTIVFSAFAGVGAFMALFSNKSTGQTWGGILSGFGMLFVGLSLMSSSMSDFASLDGVKTFLAAISNPILLVLIGAIFTAIIQSSSVMTSVVIFLFVGWILNLVSGGSFNFGVMFERMFPAAPQTQLAMFHTFFNVITVLIILPLNDFLVSLVCKAIPDSKEVETVGGFRLKYVDDNMLRTPPLAVAQTKREIIRMADLAMENFDRAINIITTLDFKEYDEFNQTEEELNFINRALVDFVVKLSNKTALSEHDHIYLSTTFRSIRDLERVGDYAENIVEYARDLSETGSSFSPDARNEIYRLKKMIEDLFSNVMGAYTDEDMGKMAQANVIEEQIDDFTKMMEDNHVARMNAGVCTPSVGVHYLELSSDTERIADHLINVAKSIRSLK